MTLLAESIGRQLAALDARTALYAKHLASHHEVAIRTDDSVNPLSTIKIAVMVLAYRDSDAARGSGTMLRPGHSKLIPPAHCAQTV